jgi:pimeloyl-ACP methyl ester carboxylesterase
MIADPALIAESSRARYPDAEGYTERDGVRIFYEVYGSGEPTVLFLPTWTFAPSRVWKMQIDYFARHHRVVVFDPRGNGSSDRPRTVDAYAETEFARDALDVMDATGTERAVLVALSRGAQRGLLLAADHAERVLGIAFVGPFFPASRLGGLRWRVMNRLAPLAAKLPPPPVGGWAGKFHFGHWQRDYPDFVRWFAGRVASERHSTRGLEDCFAWGSSSDPTSLTLSALGEPAAPLTRRAQLELARRVERPVLVICGDRDRVTPFADSRELAKATNGKLVRIRGGDHAIEGRRPVEVNLALREFVLELARDQATGGERERALATVGEENR